MKNNNALQLTDNDRLAVKEMIRYAIREQRREQEADSPMVEWGYRASKTMAIKCAKIITERYM
jgi:hypothetical protein